MKIQVDQNRHAGMTIQEAKMALGSKKAT